MSSISQDTARKAYFEVLPSWNHHNRYFITIGLHTFQEEKTEHSSRFQSIKTQGGPDKETSDAEVSTEDRDEAENEWQDTESSVFMGMNPSFAHEPVSIEQ